MLLDTTDMKINQVCHKIGIDDPFYFTSVFTKMMGCSPKKLPHAEEGVTSCCMRHKLLRFGG